MEIGLLTKQFATMNIEKVNAVGALGKFGRHDEFDSEKAKYLDREIISS